MSIGSAVFAELTAESPYTLQWAALSPKFPLPVGELDRHLIHDCFADPSPQPKGHLDWFSHFCTEDRRVSPYFTMGRPFPLKIAPSYAGI